MARIMRADGEIVEGQLLSEAVEPQEEQPVSAPASRPRPEDTATIVPEAPPPSHDTVETLDALEIKARGEWQVAIEAARELRNAADRNAYQLAVDAADRTLQRVLDD